MNHTANDHADSDMATALPWLVEMGADEVLLDAPVNRFQVPVETPKSVAAASPRPKAMVAAPKWQPDLQAHDALAAAQTMAQAVPSLEAYVEVLSGFDSHPLKKTASRPAIFMGNATPRVLIITDKPRNEEDRLGHVLAGNHLVLATRMLAAIGLAVDDAENGVGFASFIPWRPPGNRMPTEQEARLLVPFTTRLVEMLQPKAILCLGHLPGQYLAGGADAIMRARQKWLEVSGVPLLTTFHPETLLNSPASKRMAWHDLQAFAKKLESVS